MRHQPRPEDRERNAGAGTERQPRRERFTTLPEEHARQRHEHGDEQRRREVAQAGDDHEAAREEQEPSIGSPFVEEHAQQPSQHEGNRQETLGLPGP